MEIPQMSVDIFSNRTLQELTDCLFWVIEIKMIMLKDIKLKDIIYEEVLLRIIVSSSKERTFMTNQIKVSIILQGVC